MPNRLPNSFLRHVATVVWASACIFSAAVLLVLVTLYFVSSKYFFEFWLVTEHPVTEGIYVDENDSALGTIVRRRGVEVVDATIMLGTREVIRAFDVEPIEPVMGFDESRFEFRSNIFDDAVIRAAWNIRDPAGYSGRRPGQYMQGNDFAIVPWWLVFLAATTLPVIWLTRRLWKYQRLRTLRNSGRCRNCGYDLRASKDRCPECGTAILAADTTTNPQSRSDDIK